MWFFLACNVKKTLAAKYFEYQSNERWLQFDTLYLKCIPQINAHSGWKTDASKLASRFRKFHLFHSLISHSKLTMSHFQIQLTNLEVSQLTRCKKRSRPIIKIIFQNFLYGPWFLPFRRVWSTYISMNLISFACLHVLYALRSVALLWYISRDTKFICLKLVMLYFHIACC